MLASPNLMHVVDQFNVIQSPVFGDIIVHSVSHGFAQNFQLVEAALKQLKSLSWFINLFYRM